jgi:hypothetical protein
MNVGKNERVECALHALIIVQAPRLFDEFPENSHAESTLKIGATSHI